MALNQTALGEESPSRNLRHCWSWHLAQPAFVSEDLNCRMRSATYIHEHVLAIWAGIGRLLAALLLLLCVRHVVGQPGRVCLHRHGTEVHWEEVGRRVHAGIGTLNIRVPCVLSLINIERVVIGGT